MTSYHVLWFHLYQDHVSVSLFYTSLLPLLLHLQVCRAAQAALSADRKEQRLQETAERRRQGDKLAVPNPLDLMARR
jgi:hypothetical protein